MPSVSVVIPCYKYGRFLPGCVRSVLDQEGVDVRVLIIDDASPDDSAQVALDLAADDERVEARVHEVNKGHIATYNEGLLEWADGDYSVLISADDLHDARLAGPRDRRHGGQPGHRVRLRPRGVVAGRPAAARPRASTSRA